MSNYKRFYQADSYYFFTIVTYQRQKIFTSSQNIQLLKNSFKKIKLSYPFELTAIVVLPDHLHCIWKLPKNDYDYSTRLRLIKSHFSKNFLMASNLRGEKKIWQRRFWEHIIRNNEDWQKHLDYIHYNPVKHGYVNSPKDWPYSSFNKWVKKGIYEDDWGADVSFKITDMLRE